jgi:hypothetical protein
VGGRTQFQPFEHLYAILGVDIRGLAGPTALQAQLQAQATVKVARRSVGFLKLRLAKRSQARHASAADV